MPQLWLSERYFTSLAVYEEEDGIPIGSLFPEEQSGLVSRVRSSLAIVRQHSSGHYAIISRCFKRILILDERFESLRGHKFWFLNQTCVLEGDLVRRDSLAATASTLVRQATVARMGSYWTSRRRVGGILAVATTEQIDFVRLLPLETQDRDRLLASLEALHAEERKLAESRR